MKTPLRSPSIVACLRQQRTHRDGSQIAQAAGDRNPRGRRLAVPLFLFFASLATAAQADQFTAVWTGTGNWTSTANWSLNPSAPDGFAYPNNDTPAPGDSYIADINSGTATLNSGAIELDALNLSGGNLRIDSPGSLNLTSKTVSSTWSSGSITGSGLLNIASGATMNYLAGRSKFVAATINNSGIFDIHGNDGLFGPGVFNNNFGAIYKQSSGTGSSSSVVFNNNGDVVNDTVNGKLAFRRGGSYGGTTTITNAGASVEFSSGLTGMTFEDFGNKRINVFGEGQFRLWGGMHSVAAGNTLTIGDAIGVTPGRLTIDYQASLHGPGNVLVNKYSTFTWNGGTLGDNSGGAITVTEDATFNMSVGGTLAKVVNNNGIAKFTSYGDLFGSPGAEWNNNAGSIFELKYHSHLWEKGQSFGTSVFNNNRGATFLLSDGSSIVQWSFNNSGTIHIAAGTLSFSNSLINTGHIIIDLDTHLFAGSIVSTGEVSGNGRIHGAINGGTISPGESAGELTIQGTVTSDANSIFSFEIGGTSQADNSLGAAGVGAGHYDFLNVTGTLTLGPANPILDITLLDGFIPAASDKFWIIDSGQTLTDIDIFAGLPDQSRVFTSDGRGTFVIHYNQDPSGANPGAVMLDGFRLLVPEPASLVLGYLAVLGVFSPRRSRP